MKDKYQGSAVISEDGKYRYRLHRKICDGAEYPAVFIMLNPSTADADSDDQTIRKCLGFARKWGCTDLYVVNLFAIRATDPNDMRKADDPVGADNREHVCQTIRRVTISSFGEKKPLVICAWGQHGAYMAQDEEVLGWLDGVRLWCLGKTKSGQPRHPLMLSYSTPLEPYCGGAKRERMKEADCPASPEGEAMIAGILTNK